MTMQMTNKLKAMPAVLLAALLALVFGSCSETDYLQYDTSLCGIYFTKDTLAYSFSVTPDDVRQKEFRIPVRTMAQISHSDRTFRCEVIADSTTAVEGVQYTIGTPVIPADSVDGYIPVMLLRDGLAGNFSDGYTRYKLGVRLVAGNGFEPVLDAKSHVRVLRFDNAVDMPEWLDAAGEKVWTVSRFGIWHPLKLIKMVEYFHSIEGIQPETYKKMVMLYGPNLEHVQYGDFYQYNTVMTKYVFGPMFDYFSNPANKDAILSLYPDFPFDFPNPFAPSV